MPTEKADPMFSYPEKSQESPGLERDRLLNALLEQTLDLPENEREPYLLEHCPDPALRAEVLDLLAEDLGDFLEAPSPIASGESATGPMVLVPLCYFGNLAIRRGDFKTAAAMLEKAEQSQDTWQGTKTLTHAILHRSLGKAYRALDRIEEARSQFRRAVDVLESLAPTEPHLKELDQTRFDLLQLQGLLDGNSSYQSVQDFLV